MQISPETVRELAGLLHQANLGEIAVEIAGDTPQRVIVRRSAPPPVIVMAAPAGEPAEAALESAAAATSYDDSPAETGPETIRVTATAVGLFRAAAPALRVGDAVRKGQVLGSVESLKVPNDIMAPVAGRIAEILVDEGTGVEYGQPLVALLAD